MTASSVAVPKNGIVSVFVMDPKRCEAVARDWPTPFQLKYLQDLKPEFGVEDEQQWVVSHPRFPNKFVLIENPEQLYDGCTIQVTTPRKQVYVSASDESFMKIPVVWFPNANGEEIEVAMSKATGILPPLHITTESGSALAISSSIPDGTHMILQTGRPPSRAQNNKTSSTYAPSHSRSSTTRSTSRGPPIRGQSSEMGDVGGQPLTRASSQKSFRNGNSNKPFRSVTPPRNRSRNLSPQPSGSSQRGAGSSVRGENSQYGCNPPKQFNEEHCVHILQGHSGFVLCVCIVGDVLFTGSQDHNIMIWDLNNLQYIGTLPGHRGFVKCLAASFPRKLLFSGSQDKTIKVWSLETFSVIKTLFAHTADVHCITILELRDVLVSASEDKSIRIWDLNNLSPLAVIDNAHTGGIFSLDALPSNYVLSGGRDRTIKLWNDRWQVAKTLFPPHYDGVTALAVSTKRQKFYSASRDKSIKEWDGLTLENTVQQVHVHSDWITTMALSPDEEELYTGSRDCVIKVWNAETLQCKYSMSGHRGAVNAIFASNGYVFSASNDRTVRVWKPPQE